MPRSPERFRLFSTTRFFEEGRVPRQTLPATSHSPLRPGDAAATPVTSVAPIAAVRAVARGRLISRMMHGTLSCRLLYVLHEVPGRASRRARLRRPGGCKAGRRRAPREPGHPTLARRNGD